VPAQSTTRSHHIPTTHYSPTHFTFPTQLTFTPGPPGPTAWQGTNPATNQRTSNNTTAIFFEVFGGLVGFVLILGLTRCLYNYSKTPPRDRISAVVNRHQLQREMEELERNPLALRRASLREPAPPPYVPKPPSYSERPSSPPMSGSDYSEVRSGSPLDSPITLRRSLEAQTAAPNHSPPGQ
jgi:hypothetical protein